MVFIFKANFSMGHQLVRVCVFCLLCATHAHCSSHHDIDNTHAKKISDHNSYSDGGGGHIAASDKSDPKSEPDIRSNWMDNQVFVQMVFQNFGDGEKISMEGFEKLLRALRLDGLISLHPRTSNSTSEHNIDLKDSRNSSSAKNTKSREFVKIAHCVSSENLMGGALVLTPSTYKDVCPVLLSQFLPQQMHNTMCKVGTIHSHSHLHRNKMQDQIQVWLYASLSVIVISMCGLLGVIVIPIMKRVFYKHILQFLVALAVGTLCGDALLHLLPHSMNTPDDLEHVHGHSSTDIHHHHHHDNLYKGLVAMFGVIFFYFMEKCLTLIAEMRTSRLKKSQLTQKVRVMRDAEPPSSNTTGEKLCKHKYSSYPYCYGEIADNPEGHMKGPGDLTDRSPNSKDECGPDSCRSVFKKTYSNDHSNGRDLTKENESLDVDKKLLDTSTDAQNADERYTVIIREHESSHHGHSHTHGHVHSAPQSFSSVAMMVVFGDGLHNFTDGMAIGAAFSANIAGGFSTALAVFCHELPHELGDFAVLLQAGMSAKQAVFYNLLSSILCFVGMCFGVFLGHSERTTEWVFAAAAGMFLYIALVDMIPELTNSHSKGGALFQCVLQLAGLLTGVGVMFLIAVYEHDLKNVFGD